MSRLNLFISLFLISVHSFSYAQVTYYWTPGSLSQIPNVKTAHPLDACIQGFPKANTQHGLGVWNENSTEVGCYRRTIGTTSYQFMDFVYRGSESPNSGQSCGNYTEPGTNTNFPKIINSDGECVNFIVADKPSQCKNLSTSTTAKRIHIAFDGEGNAINPGTISIDGCEGTVLGVGGCKHAPIKSSGGVSLGPAPALCLVPVNFNGNTAPGDLSFINPNSNNPGLCPPGEACDPPQPPDVTDKQPCTYSYDAEGRQVCTSSNFHGKPGQYSYCGTVNGKFHCEGQKPTSNGIQIDTTVSTQQNQDGTTTTTKTDKYQNVKCTGIGSCTTSTTTTTQISVTNGSGQTVSQNTSCTGPGCSSGGAAGEGDGDGDGVDDCLKTNSCPEESGPVSPLAAPELDEQPSVADTTGGYMNRIKQAPIAQALAIVVPSGGTCSFGSAQTFIGAISFDEFCDMAPTVLAPLRYLFLAIWAWGAIRLYFTA